MKIFLVLLFFLLLVLGFFGFQNMEQVKSPQPAPKASVTNTVRINSETFRVRLAVSADEQQLGLGGVTNMADDEGMLFLYDRPSYSPFWMRGMKIPLDIIFILNNRVVGVFEDLPPAGDSDPNPPTYGGHLLSDRVLEINAGLAKKYGIMVGDKVIIKL